MMDTTERARLRALCEAATPGPWDAIYDEDAGEWMVRTGHADVAVLTWQQAIDALGLSPMTMRTAAFIAASRTAIPALLDDLDAADVRASVAERERDVAVARLARRREAGFAARTILDATATESALDAARRVARERDEAVAMLREIRARVHRDGGQHVDAVGLAQATREADEVIVRDRAERDEARAEVERLRASEASRRELMPAVLDAVRKVAREEEREACAALCETLGDAAEQERDACCDDRSRSLHAGRMHGADECARAIRARGTGGAR